MPEVCNICLTGVMKPLNTEDFLLCDCKYNVHYKCFYRWWRENESCIICHKKCNKPLKESLVKVIDKRRKRTRTPVRYTSSPRYFSIRDDDERLRFIENYINNIPFDNENELKTLFIIAISIIILSYLTGYFQ